MNIDFPPPSNGIYNNAVSSRQLANYLEHEDMQRMEQGICTEQEQAEAMKRYIRKIFIPGLPRISTKDCRRKI